MQNSLNFLSTRNGFNGALRHFKKVNKFINLFKRETNLADLINEGLEDKSLAQHQISVILNALLVDKFGYFVKSFNLTQTYPEQLSGIAKIVKDWNALDIVVSYYHPQLGQIVINPKSEESWEAIDILKQNELVVLYIGNFDDEIEHDLAKECGEALEAIFDGEKITTSNKFKKTVQAASTPQKEIPKKAPPKKVPVEIKAAPAPAKKPGGKKKLSPHYGVTVTNELFHNGNVEAWKKIIASYQAKYSDVKVLVFYEGEQIHDINTLFKWGKVKHGTNIYFSLLGTDFKDISKLRRYLMQGASSRFSDFLKGDPSKVLVLF